MIDVEALLTDARAQVTENGGRNYGWHGRLIGRLIAAIEQLQADRWTDEQIAKTMDENKRLQTENAKLRELVNDFNSENLLQDNELKGWKVFKENLEAVNAKLKAEIEANRVAEKNLKARIKRLEGR